MGERVFVHEPDGDVAALYRTALAHSGWTVVERAAEADVLVVDADPVGRELAAAYREKPVVMVSVYFRDELPEVAALASRFLVKPFPLGKLIAAVAESLRAAPVSLPRERAEP